MTKATLYWILLILSTWNLAAQDREGMSHYKWIENKGQWPDEVAFSAEIESGYFYVKNDGFLLDFKNPEEINALSAAHHSPTPNPILPDRIRAHAYSVEFVGCGNAYPQGKNQQMGTYNYFKGDDPARWGRKCSAFGEVFWEDLYPGIDLHLYSNDFFMKYDFALEPGADPSLIRMKYEDVDALKIENGRLVIKTSVSEVIEQRPICYQIRDGVKTLISASYKLSGTELSFELLEPYDPNLSLIIDPELIFSSYSGSFSNNFGYTATFDDQGFLYSGSSAFGAQYPVTTGAYEINFQSGIVDVALSKWDTTGTFLIWSSYLGGSNDELPHSLIVNSNRELFVYGTTSSLDFPTSADAYDGSYNGGNGLNLLQGLGVNYTNGSDIFVSRFSADGSDLLASTYIGGSGNDGLNVGTPLKYNYADEIRGEILIDQENNIYIASSTNSNDFPVSGGSFQPINAGGDQEGCIFKMDNNLSTLLWSSYLGGSGNDAVYALDLESNDDVIVCGGTQSEDFPVTFGTIQQAYGGGLSDGFISRISSDGSSIVQSSFWGTESYDQIYFVETDAEDNVFIFGQTEHDSDFYIVNADYGTPASGQFISKFIPDVSELVWSTAFGTGSGSPNISPTAFLVDLCNKIYLSGWGSSIQGGPLSVTGMEVTDDAYQNTTTGGDFYLFVLEDDASDIFYGSYYGGSSSSEHVDGGTSRFDRKGVMYQAVCAGCGGNDDFPIEPVPGAVSALNNSNCNLGVFKFDFNIPVTIADFFAPDAICVDTPIEFDNLSNLGSAYSWDFGDNSESDEFEPFHSYDSPGTYEVRLIVTNPLSCNEADTVFQSIRVLNNSSSQILTAELCAGDSIQIGVAPSADPSISYSWSPAESLSNPNIANPFFTGSESNDYLLQISNGICVDTVFQSVELNSINLQLPDDLSLCEPGTLIELEAASDLPGTEYIWSDQPDFSNPLNDGPDDPSVELEVFGPQTLYLSASNNGCIQTGEVFIDFNSTQTELNADRVICAGDTVELFVLSPSPLLSYAWSPEELILSGQNTTNVLVAPTQPTTYFVESANSEGCITTDSVNVSLSGLAQGSISATAEPTVILNQQSSQLTVAPSGLDYLWSPAGSLDNPFSDSPIANPEESTTYFVRVEDGDCSYLDSVRVEVVDFICGPPIIYVPNAFTPNGDRKNELLYVRGLNLTRVHLEIYNRWGELVFEANSQDEGWDGTYKGQPVDPAVFVYYLEADCGDGESYFEKGNITVIR